MRRTTGFFAVLLILASALPLSGQVDYATGTLKGTISDPQGMLVAGARVTIDNPSTGWSRVVQTAADGAYRVPLLPPGTYKVRVEASGFSTVLATVSLSVGEVVNYDVRMELGAIRQTIEVTEDPSLVQIERTQLANTIGREEAVPLPNITHLFTDSVFTLPGVSKSEAPRAQTPGFSGFQSTGFSIGGSNGRSNLITIDGGENDMGAGALRTPHVPLESVQEFQVNRSSFAAEFGFTTGTAVNVVTRSGSNRWHGGTHAFFGDQHSNARNYFAPKNAQKAFEQDLLTGFTLSGPLLRNRVFLFTAYEFTKRDTPQFRNYASSEAAKGIRSNPAQQNYVDQLANSGDSVLQSTAVQLAFLLDPSNFPNSAKLLLPNSGVFNDWKKYHNWVTRVDYQPTSNDTLTTRFSFTDDAASRMDVLDPSNSPDDATLIYQTDYTVLGVWNHVFSPQLVNQLRVQVVPSYVVDAPVVSPHTAHLRIAGLGQFGGEHRQPFYAHERRYQFEDSVARTSGKHTFKFGASYRPFSYLIRQELFFNGDFQFFDGAIPIVGGLIQPTDSAFTRLVGFNLAHGWPAGGDPAANLTAFETFDLGIPVTYRQGFGNPQVSGSAHYIGIFAQDSWKPANNVTLDFGGRLDMYAPSAPAPRHTYFSPRLAFAWSPGADNKTIVRGGGGVFVAPLPFFVDYVVNLLGDSGDYINQVATTFSFTDRRVLTLWERLTGCSRQPPYVCAEQPPFPQLHAADMTAVGLQIGPGQPGRVVFDIADNYKNNYSIQANVGIQRQLAADLMLELAYSMYHGVHLQVPVDTNIQETGVVDPFAGPMYTRIAPDIVQMVTYSSTGSSIYHGFLASLTRRFNRRLQFQVNYTFSKTIGDTTDFNSEFMPFRSTRMDLERGLSTFNVKHNFVANAVYALPTQPGYGFLSHVLADVTVSPVLFMRSGIPFTIRVPGLQNGTLGESLWARPWRAGRNTGRGTSFSSLDLRLAKSFFLERDKGRRIDFIVQGTNILNHTNFSAVNDSFPANPDPFQLGGRTVDLLNGPYDLQGIAGLDASQPLAFKAAFDPRQLQLALKVVF